MTFKELYEYSRIKDQIENLEKKLESLSEISSSSISTNISKSNKVSNPTEEIVSKKIQLENKIQNKLKKFYEQEIKIEDFIENIEDAEIELIIRMRFLDLMTWGNIARKLQYDRSTPYYKIKRYLEIYNKELKTNAEKKKS